MLFKVTKFVIICYSNERKLIQSLQANVEGRIFLVRQLLLVMHPGAERGSGRIPHFSVALGLQVRYPKSSPWGSPSAASFSPSFFLPPVNFFSLLVTPLP